MLYILLVYKLSCMLLEYCSKCASLRSSACTFVLIKCIKMSIYLCNLITNLMGKNIRINAFRNKFYDINHMTCCSQKVSYYIETYLCKRNNLYILFNIPICNGRALWLQGTLIVLSRALLGLLLRMRFQ